MSEEFKENCRKRGKERGVSKLMLEKVKEHNKKTSKQVNKYDLNWDYIKTFESVQETVRQDDLSLKGTYRSLNNKRGYLKSKGYYYKFK